MAVPSPAGPKGPASGQLLVNGHLVGLVVGREPPGDHDRAAEDGVAARVQGQVGKAAASQGAGAVVPRHDDCRCPQRLAHLRECGQLRPLPGKVNRGLVPLQEIDAGVDHLVVGEEAGEGGIGPAGTGHGGQDDPTGQPREQDQQDRGPHALPELRPHSQPDRAHGSVPTAGPTPWGNRHGRHIPPSCPARRQPTAAGAARSPACTTAPLRGLGWQQVARQWSQHHLGCSGGPLGTPARDALRT